jgi:hypothetical protein
MTEAGARKLEVSICGILKYMDSSESREVCCGIDKYIGACMMRADQAEVMMWYRHVVRQVSH